MTDNFSLCPNCGHWQAIPNGIYSSIDGIMSYIATTANPLLTSKQLKDDFERIQRGEKPRSEHATKVERFLRDNKETVKIALIVLTAAITIYAKTDHGPSKVEINNLIQQNYTQQINLK